MGHLSDIAQHKFCTTSHPELPKGEKQQQLSGNGTVILPSKKKKIKLKYQQKEGTDCQNSYCYRCFLLAEIKQKGDRGLGFV